ncbi:MAG: glycosyltransferase [Bacteroidota bacterium]
MKPGVTHLIRAFLPPATSFVSNQIMHHVRYAPSVAYTEKRESLLFDEITSRFPSFQAVTGAVDSFICSRFLQFTPSGERRLAEWLRNTSPAVLHVHYGVEAILFSDVIRKMNIPAMVSFYGHDCTSFPLKYHGLGRIMLRNKVFLNPRIRMITAMSPDMRADLVALGCPAEKIRIHYHGTDTGRFSMERDYRERECVNFLIISLLDEKKGHNTLIEAFIEASGITSRKIVLNIVGDGELKEAIARQIRESGAGNILMHGFVKYGSSAHLALLKNADVFVHPSITTANGNKEGIPGAIMEAMSAGLPVIATVHAGIPYAVVDGKTGILVEERNRARLTDAIVRLAENAELRREMGMAGREHVRGELDIRKKEEELETLYDELAGPGI